MNPHDELPKGMEPPEGPETKPGPTPPGRVVHFGDVGGLVDEVQAMFQAGKVRGLLVIVAGPDDTYDIGHAGQMSYVEQLGALALATRLVHLMSGGGEAG